MKKALISVFDKTGVVEFAASLVELGYEIISMAVLCQLYKLDCRNLYL